MLPKTMTLLITVSAVFIGVILLLGNMGIIPNTVMAIWPVVLIVAGLIGLTCIDPEKRRVSSSSTSKKRRK